MVPRSRTRERAFAVRGCAPRLPALLQRPGPCQRSAVSHRNRLASLAATATLLLTRGSPAAEPEPNASPLTSTSRPATDMPTLLGIGATSYVATAVLHEALGHMVIGCGLAAERMRGFSLAVAACEENRTTASHRIVAGAAVPTNLLAGGALATSLLLAPPKDGETYYFEWLTMTINLMQASGYLMFGPWIPASDMGTRGVLRGISSPLAAQLGMSLTGTAMMGGTLFLANHLVEPLLGDEPSVRSSRRWTLTIPAYLFGSTLVTSTSLLTRGVPEAALTAAIANFAGTLFLAYMPLFFSSDTFYPSRGSHANAKSIERSIPWLVVGAASTLAAVFVLGPGLGRFDEPHPFDPSRR